MRQTSFDAPSGESGGGGSASPSAGEIDSGLACLVMIARFHGLAADPSQLTHEFKESGEPFGSVEILLAAKKLGLRARQVSTRLSRLLHTPLPAIAIDRDGRFCVIARADYARVLLHDPRSGKPEILALAAFEARWTGQMILFASRASLSGELAKFDFTWFIPAIVKYRKLLGEVLLVSFALQLS